jgi:hypothetical protein
LGLWAIPTGDVPVGIVSITELVEGLITEYLTLTKIY